MQRRRFKNILTFPNRLADEAKRFRQQAERLRSEAEKLPQGQERETLLRKARQAEAAARVDEWVSSPGLRAPG
jgi:hypothetical protein